MAGHGVARFNAPLSKPFEPVPVARPELPKAEAVLPYMRQIDESRWYSNFGPLLTEFETRLAARFEPGTQIVTCANATQALALTLQAMQLPKGSLCAMPAYTFVATAHAVIAAGLIPYFLDVDPDDWMLRPQTVRQALARAPGAISAVILVAPFGLMPDPASWLALREETGVAVLLDAAAAFDDAHAAALPTVVSLHATKVLGIGEGGFLATEDGDLAQRVRQLTTYGFKGSRESRIPATNAKLSEYAGAIGLAPLRVAASRSHLDPRTARVLEAIGEHERIGLGSSLKFCRIAEGRADDYMAKPFSLQELEARVRALTRRGMGATSSTIKHGPLVYDQAGRVATIDGKMIELSARELGLLEVLLQRAGRLVSKDQLVERLCEWGEEVSNNAIEVYIHRLRKKIEKGPIRIATVRGLGYCLEKIPG